VDLKNIARSAKNNLAELGVRGPGANSSGTHNYGYV